MRNIVFSLILFSFSCNRSHTHEEEIILSEQTYWYNNNDFVISSKFTNTNYDIVQLWRPCMQQNENTIFTFFTVWLKNNPNNHPLLCPEYTQNMFATMNISSSDNILATRLKDITTGVVEYTGGWHLTSDGKITARTTEWSAYADGKRINKNDYGYADRITIIVKTDVYNPFKRDKYYNPFEVVFEETIIYDISSGNILVEIKHEFKQKCHIDSYGGVGSKALGKEMFFPNGHTIDFVAKHNGIGLNNDSVNVSKKKYPHFNRFIQRDYDLGWYESLYLFPNEGIGDHSKLPDNAAIYWTYADKIYHRLIQSCDVSVGDKHTYKALYTWFEPLYENNVYLIYKAKAKNENLLFIDMKQFFEGVIDLDVSLDNSKVLQIDETLTFSKNSLNKLEIKGFGTLILTY